MEKCEEYGFATRVIHEGQGNNPHGALATPIFMTSTFCFEDVEDGMQKFAKEKPGFVYARSGNPTTAALEAKCAAMEGGEVAMATSSGMGAISSVILSLLKMGDHIISGDTSMVEAILKCIRSLLMVLRFLVSIPRILHALKRLFNKIRKCFTSKHR